MFKRQDTRLHQQFLGLNAVIAVYRADGVRREPRQLARLRQCLVARGGALIKYLLRFFHQSVKFLHSSTLFRWFGRVYLFEQAACQSAFARQLDLSKGSFIAGNILAKRSQQELGAYR